jgi:hypothetical protein
MITASEWKAYNDGVAAISDSVEREVIEGLLAWHANYPDATVAESREYAKSLMNSTVRSYDSLSASFAATWYDYQAELNGARLDQAITATVYTPKSVDEVARYQAKKLVKGDFEGFAEACGEYARNDALRSLNETIMANAKRDRKKGVRFARVTTGNETCTFCLMLAGRGAVYHSRKTAGEFSHFHRGCDCKVVPGFENDPMAELVEGHDPKVVRRQCRRIESARDSATIQPTTLSLEALEKTLKEAWAGYIRDGKTADAFRNNVGAAVAALVPDNSIAMELYARPEAKELQEAIWLAECGHKVEFRNANDNRGGNTSDVYVDGVTCDFKKPESSKLKKMVKLVTSKIKRQGPAFLIDLTGSNIKFEQAEVRCAALLDDERISLIYLVGNGKLETIKK